MKKITGLIIVLASTLFAGNSRAQFASVWTYQYQHTASIGYSNEGRKIAEDPSGNIFMLADATSDVDPSGTHGAILYHYVTLTKYTSNGAMAGSMNVDVQAHVVSGFNNFSAFGLEIDPAGNVFIGYSTYDGATDFDIQLGMYDNNLNRIWTNFYSTVGTDVGVELKLGPAGTLYAVIKSTDLTTVYSVIQSVPGFSAASLIYSFAGNGPVINSIALDGLQTVFVAGYSMKGAHKNAYVASINVPNRSINWESLYTPAGIVGDDVANKITIGADGNVYTVGTSYQGSGVGDEVLVLKNLPGSDRFDFIVLLRGMGLNDKGLIINASESGWLYIGSVSDNLAVVYRVPSNGAFSSVGKVVYAPTPTAPYTSINGITLTAMKISSVKNIYITGGVSATGPSGSFTSSYLNKTAVVFGNALIRAGGVTVDGDANRNFEGIDISLDYGKADIYWLRNYWDDAHDEEIVEVIDVNVPSPLRQKSGEQSPNRSNIVSLSPNPANETVRIESSLSMTSIEIMDQVGNRVLLVPSDAEQVSFDVSFLAPGIYSCNVNTREGNTVKKLVIN